MEQVTYRQFCPQAFSSPEKAWLREASLDPLSPREGLASETSDSGSRSSSGDTGEGELVEVAVLRYTMFGPKKQVSDSSYRVFSSCDFL